MLQTRTPRNSQRGAMIVIMAFSLALIMGMAALVFDLAFVRLARLQMQNVADASAHAAMHKYKAKQPEQRQAIDIAKSVAASNTVLGRPVTLTDADIVFGTWDTRSYPATSFTTSVGPPNAVTVTGRISDPNASAGSVALAFGNVFGFSQSDVTRSGIAGFRTRGIMLCLDVTGSFIFPPDDPPVYRARAASLQFLDVLHAMNVTSDRIGMQIFTGKSFSYTPIQNLKDNYYAIRDKWDDVHICQKPGFPWPPAPQGPDDPKMPLCGDRDGTASYPYGGGPPGNYGGSNPGACLRAAADELIAKAAPYEIPIVVLITDGEPMCCTHPQGGGLCSGTAPGAPCCDASVLCTSGSDVCQCAKETERYGNQMADSVARDGVSIFTISFTASDMDPTRKSRLITYNAGLVRGIGKPYNTPDATQIAQFLTEIANSIPVTLVK